MTLEEKIIRYQNIPKRIAELKIDKEICTSVKAVQYDSIGEGKGTSENRTEAKMVDAAAISEEIEQLEKEYDILKLDILQKINNGIIGDGVREVDMRTILKERMLYGRSFNYIANKVVHINRKSVSALYHEGCSILKISPIIPINST